MTTTVPPRRHKRVYWRRYTALRPSIQSPIAKPHPTKPIPYSPRSTPTLSTLSVPPHRRPSPIHTQRCQSPTEPHDIQPSAIRNADLWALVGGTVLSFFEQLPASKDPVNRVYSDEAVHLAAVVDFARENCSPSYLSEASWFDAIMGRLKFLHDEMIFQSETRHVVPEGNYTSAMGKRDICGMGGVDEAGVDVCDNDECEADQAVENCPGSGASSGGEVLGNEVENEEGDKVWDGAESSSEVSEEFVRDDPESVRREDDEQDDEWGSMEWDVEPQQESYELTAEERRHMGLLTPDLGKLEADYVPVEEFEEGRESSSWTDPGSHGSTGL